MSFRKRSHGKPYPITPRKGGIDADTFYELQRQDLTRRNLSSQLPKKEEGIMERLKPNKVQVTAGPKEGYLPTISAEWNLKKQEK